MRRTKPFPAAVAPDVQEPRELVVALLYREGRPDEARLRKGMAAPDGSVAELATLLGTLFRYPLYRHVCRGVYEAGIVEALASFHCRKVSFLRACLGNLDDRQVRRLAVLLACLGLDGDAPAGGLDCG